MTDLWSEASYDYDAERQARNLEMAKAASQGTWAFLALAQSPEEYGHRVALASDQIMATAAASGVDMNDLIHVFDQRFALLMEAKSNPFDDDSDDDSDDSDQDGDSDDSGDDDSDDSSDSDDDSDSDDSDDDSDSGDDESDDSDDDDAKGKSQGIAPWASRYSSLAQRIEAGEDPLTWGGAPFAHSSARKEAADGADGPGPVSDVNSPQAGQGLPGDPGGVPGMNGGIAETTKPRQMPGGADPTMAPGMGMDGIGGPGLDSSPGMDAQFDPATNGGDIQQSANDLPPAQDTGRMAKIKAIATEVKRYNPTLSSSQCRKVAARVYDQYLVKHAEDMNPLLFGDRGGIGDGPATQKVKNWAPADLKPAGGPGVENEPGPEGDDGPPGPMRGLPSGLEEAAAGAAARGVAAEVGGAARLLPLLAL
jgi:hypothetical protein